MTDRIRWGILATGGIADRFVADLKLLPGAELAAVGSRSTAAAEAFAARHGIPRAHGSWAELAADPDLDVVYVATPHAAHHAAAKRCLDAGKAVLCEKPLTLDLDSARDLVRTARERGVFFMEAMWMRTIPAIRRVRELVAGGAIGTITAVLADFDVAGPFPPEHRMRARELGGGALLDLGVYPVTFAYLFLGAPEQVTALATLGPEGTDESTAVAMSFASGATATLHCGILGPGPVTATVIGTQGRIELPAPFFSGQTYRLVPGTPGAAAEQVEVPRRGNGLGYEAEEVMRCLAAGLTESPLVPHAETLDIMRILDQIREQIGVTYP
ncbi:MAG: Gfo/Idh/MocA family oxidoreductase [Micromonosporaceae bacterium]|nr:Gfo/Idh/MocA family oxidoreductase [Micromonosporaceae bacterium]